MDIMDPWQLLGNLTAWALIGLLALFVGMIVISVVLSLSTKARTKRRLAEWEHQTTVFKGKRDSWSQQ